MATELPNHSSALFEAALIAEYSSLRDESSQARQAQQATLQWSLATFGAIFAGGLIFLGQAQSLDRTHVTSFVYFFGLAVPWFATFASWVWWGECRRMERAGTYLREVEETVEQLTGRSAPMQWERYIAWGPARLPFASNSVNARVKIGYLGALGIYFGAVLTAVGISWVLSAQHRSYFGWVTWPLWINFVVVIVVHITQAVSQAGAMQTASAMPTAGTEIRFRSRATVPPRAAVGNKEHPAEEDKSV